MGRSRWKKSEGSEHTSRLAVAGSNEQVFPVPGIPAVVEQNLSVTFARAYGNTLQTCSAKPTKSASCACGPPPSRRWPITSTPSCATTAQRRMCCRRRRWSSSVVSRTTTDSGRSSRGRLGLRGSRCWGSSAMPPAAASRSMTNCSRYSQTLGRNSRPSPPTAARPCNRASSDSPPTHADWCSSATLKT